MEQKQENQDVTVGSEHIEGRKNDPVFQDSLRDRLKRAQRLLGK